MRYYIWGDLSMKQTCGILYQQYYSEYATLFPFGFYNTYYCKYMQKQCMCINCIILYPPFVWSSWCWMQKIRWCRFPHALFSNLRMRNILFPHTTSYCALALSLRASATLLATLTRERVVTNTPLRFCKWPYLDTIPKTALNQALLK